MAPASNDSATRREARTWPLCWPTQKWASNDGGDDWESIDPSNPPPRNQTNKDDDSDGPQRSYDLNDDYKNLPFLQELRRASMQRYYVMPKIPKYDGRGDPTKYLNSYKTHMSLRGASLAVKCRAFHLTLSGATKIWYNRLFPGSIRSQPEFETTFLKRFVVSKEGDASIQCLQDMRQQPEKSLKSFLSQFIDEMTQCVQVMNHEALSTLQGDLNMNTLFQRDVQN